MAKPKIREEWELFISILNNHGLYPELEDVAEHYEIRMATLKRWMNDYEDFRLKVDRSERKNLPKVHSRGKARLYAIPHEDDTSHLGGPGGYCVTSALFGSRVNRHVLKAMKVYAKRKGAKCVVLPSQYGTTYKLNKATNEYELITALPSVITKDEDLTVVYAERQDEVELSHKVAINTQRLEPTLDQPLSRLEAVGGKQTQIFGHPKMDMKAVAVDNVGTPKLLICTGAITYPDRYKESKKARIARERHCWGFVYVHVNEDGTFHYRQILSNEFGEFYDIDGVFYTPSGAKKQKNAVDSLVMADLHNGATDPVCLWLTFCKGGVVDTLRPQWIHLHDSFNGHSVSEHDKKDKRIMSLKAARGLLDVETELQQLLDRYRWMMKMAPGAKFKVVPSNHCEWLDRWLNSDDPLSSYKQWLSRVEFARVAETYGKLVRIVEEYQQKHPHSELGAMPIYMIAHMTAAERKRFIFLERDDDSLHPLDAADPIKMDMHGDMGSKGSKGSVAQFARASMRTFTGHAHTPVINGTAWQVGTSTGRERYVKGLCDWLNTHGIVYKNSQRQMINLIDGAFSENSIRVLLEDCPPEMMEVAI
ncbi:MAG: hypothetical protein VX730_03515 [Pseudomonadota bacterium]|nr:hypothetical protein [Pseudomonadota bacterium]